MATRIHRRQVQDLVATGAQLVDVLSPDEYETEHLPGASNVPLRSLARDATRVLDRDQPVIVYCHDSL